MQAAQITGGGSTRVRRRGIERGKLLMGSCVWSAQANATHAPNEPNLVKCTNASSKDTT